MIPLGILATTSGAAAVPAYELISTTLISSNTTSVTFSSIAQTYKHLQVRYTARTNTSDIYTTFSMRLNGVTSASYASHYLYGYAGSVSCNSSANRQDIVWNVTAAATSTANAFGAGVIDIPDYASTARNKTTRSFSGGAVYDINHTYCSQVGIASGALFSTSAITSVELYNSSTAFVSGSRFSLYGIKG